MDHGIVAVRVVVAIETRIYREGIMHMLDRHNDTSVVASASTQEQILEACVDHAPDILLLDAMMFDALDITRQVKKQFPDIKLIVLAISACRQEMITFANEGVHEFLTREDSLSDLHRCIDAAMNDGFWCSNQVAALLLQKSTRSYAEAETPACTAKKPVGEIAALTSQQVKVLHYIESGLSNKAIARRLNIETATVKNHVHHILRKLGVNTRGEAAATYRREGFLNEVPRIA